MTSHCDNQVVVACLCSHSSRQPELMHLIRCLVYIEARFAFTVYPTFIETKANHLADDLYRNRISSFLSKVPQVDVAPTPTSSRLLELLLNQQAADWVLESWRHQFRDTLTRAWHNTEDIRSGTETLSPILL